jgi:hypothetical protein
MTRMARGSMSTVYPGRAKAFAGFDDRPGPVIIGHLAVVAMGTLSLPII